MQHGDHSQPLAPWTEGLMAGLRHPQYTHTGVGDGGHGRVSHLDLGSPSATSMYVDSAGPVRFKYAQLLVSGIPGQSSTRLKKNS